MDISIRDLLDTAHRAADAAGQVILRHFRAELAADHKGGAAFDPVTAADRGAESAIRDILAREFPGHGIVGEEFGSVNEGADYVWTIDPIDGTRAFILGFPLWGTLIGLLHQGKPLLGLMDQPFTRERFWNDKQAAWYRRPDGEMIRCVSRKGRPLSEAFLTASSPDMFKGDDALRFARLAHAVRMQRFGGDCYAYCMVALGHIDIVAEAQLKPFDIVPLVPILEKAGGIITAWDGGSPLSGGRCVACGDPELLPRAIALLR